MLMRWCAELLEDKHFDDQGPFECFEQDTVEGYRADIDASISSAARNGTMAMWPIVKKVSYGIYCPYVRDTRTDCNSIGVAHSRVLSEVTVVDLPGWYSNSRYLDSLT